MTLRRRERVEAAAELDAAIDWYAKRRTLIAVEFVDAVEAAIAHIIDWPDSGRPYPGGEHRTTVVRTKRVRGFPYSVIYLIDGGDLVIVAYPHDKQRPGYWKHRLDT